MRQTCKAKSPKSVIKVIVHVQAITKDFHNHLQMSVPGILSFTIIPFYTKTHESSRRINFSSNDLLQLISTFLSGGCTAQPVQLSDTDNLLKSGVRYLSEWSFSSVLPNSLNVSNLSALLPPVCFSNL